MAQGICSVEGCERFGIVTRGWCGLHYQRWRRHGDPSINLKRVADPKRPPPPPMPPCTIEGCDRDQIARGICHTHYEKFRRRGELQTGYSKAGSANPAWRGDAIRTASGVHNRLRKAFGSASNYPCANCGFTAHDWAFDEPTGFSADLSRYRPLCRKCHMGEDQRARVWRGL